MIESKNQKRKTVAKTKTVALPAGIKVVPAPKRAPPAENYFPAPIFKRAAVAAPCICALAAR